MSLSEVTKVRREAKVALWIEVLSGEEDHLAVQPHLTNRRDLCRAQVTQVDALDHGADGS